MPIPTSQHQQSVDSAGYAGGRQHEWAHRLSTIWGPSSLFWKLDCISNIIILLIDTLLTMTKSNYNLHTQNNDMLIAYKATLSCSPAHPLFSILMSNKNATALGENTITGWAQMFLGSPTSSLCLAPGQKLVVAVFGFSLGELHSIRIVRGIWKMNTPSVWAFVCCWRKCKPHERWHQFLRWDSCCRGLRTQCHCRPQKILCINWLNRPSGNKETMHYYTNNVSIDRKGCS